MAQRVDGIDLGYLSEHTDAVPKRYKSRETIASGPLNDYYEKPPARRSGAKSVGAITMLMTRASYQETQQPNRTPMEFVNVRCNFARNRVEVLAGGDLIMHFDQFGMCKMPKHKMYLLELVQAARPGRFTIVEDEAVVTSVPVSTPEPKAPVVSRALHSPVTVEPTRPVAVVLPEPPVEAAVSLSVEKPAEPAVLGVTETKDSVKAFFKKKASTAKVTDKQ